MTTTGSLSLLVKQAGSAAAEALHRGLRAAGLRLAIVPTVYDVPAEADRAAGGIRQLILGVDHFGPGEFRIIPLVRREWPATVVVAYHSPGFEHKGRIAELVGADVILATPDDLSRFVEGLAPSAAPVPAEAPPTVPPVEAAAPAAPAPAPAPAAAEPTAEGPAKEGPWPSIPPAVKQYLAGGARPAATGTPESVTQPQTREVVKGVENLDGDDELAQGKVLGTIELTEDELRILLGEDDES